MKTRLAQTKNFNLMKTGFGVERVNTDLNEDRIWDLELNEFQTDLMKTRFAQQVGEPKINYNLMGQDLGLTKKTNSQQDI